MKSVFEYTDYRLFLQDYYNDKKAANKAFSHRFIADRVGFKSGGSFFTDHQRQGQYLHHVY